MKTLWLWIVLGLAGCLSAQEETLFGDQTSHGGFGGPVWKATRTAGRMAAVSGGRGAWIINHRVTLGGGGYGLIMDVKTDATTLNGSPIYLNYAYSGFEIGFIDKPERIVHATACLLLGGGDARLKVRNPHEEIMHENFFAVEPSAGVEFNITHWFRIDLTGAWMIPIGLESIKTSDVGGPNAMVTLKFGKF
jgi:hypothetical protein